MRNFIYATAVLIGTIVGVGIFALPYTARESGFPLFLAYLLGMGGLVTALHLMLGEVFLRTKGNHRIPGLVRIYLGESWYALARIITILGTTGTLLVYMIVGGRFLGHIVNGYSEHTYILIFWAVFTLFILGGFTLFEIAELVMGGLLVGITMLAMRVAYPHIAWNNLLSFPEPGPRLFFPYGIVLFSMLGTVAIPALHQILKNNVRRLRLAIMVGTGIPIVVYAVFVIAIYGVSGSNTTEDAIQGFAAIIGNGFTPFLYLFGFLAIATSYITLGGYAFDTYRIDFRVPRAYAALGALGVPLLLYFAGFKNYLQIIGVMGGILGSIEGLLLLMVHYRSKNPSLYTPTYSIDLSRFWYGVLILLFLCGLAVSILALTSPLLN